MYNKFDATYPIAEQSVPDMPNSHPLKASVLPEIVEGQALLNFPIPILKIFKKRMDNWIPATNALIENTYQLEQLFNQHITVNDLKNSICSVKDLTEILCHSKMSMHNRYILLMTLIAIFPASTQPNTVPTPFSDDKFLASLIHDANVLRYLLNTVFPENLAIKFLQWARLNSTYLTGILESANVIQYQQPVLMQLQPQQIYTITHMNPFPQPVHSFPCYQIPSPIQNKNHIFGIFTKRIEKADQKILNSFKYYQENLFDKNLTVAQLKDSIQTLDDLLKIFEKSLTSQHKACYSLFNYLISVFPLPENNGNLRSHPCDESFLKKIIRNQDDINTISDYFGSGSQPNFRKILEHRLLKCSTHCRLILQPQPQPQPQPLQFDFNNSLSFFSSNIQSITRPRIYPKNSLDSLNNNMVLKESLPRKPIVDNAPGSEHWESDRLNQRPLKRLKANPTMIVESLVNEQVPLQHSVGVSSSFFSSNSTPEREIQEPEGGELIYVMDQYGKMSAIDEATGLSIF